MAETIRAVFQSPLLLWLTVGFFITASITTFDKRLEQAKGRGDLPEDEPSLPKWIALFFWLQMGIVVALLVTNWRYGLFVYALGFVLAVLPVLETIGNVLVSPFRRRVK